MPRAHDFPNFSVGDREHACARTTRWARRACGEVGAIGSPPAVINAVVDALRDYGVRHIEMPATPGEGLGDHSIQPAADGG